MGNITGCLCTDIKTSVGPWKSKVMEGKGKLSDDSAFKALQDFYNKNGSKFNIPQLFKEDPDRFKKFR